MCTRTIIFISLFSTGCLFAQLPVGTTADDFFLSGSQPLESGDLSKPTNCNCHDYNGSYIYSYWEGSMMAHALVDPLFTAALAIANQDAGSSGDLCLRCHTPTGWLSGRSFPTDGSSLISEDESSVNCKFCHRIVKPTPFGVNPYSGDATYTTNTYPMDQDYLARISDHIPATSGDGMYVVDSLSDYRRGPYYITSGGNHHKVYSPFHREADLCGTCHDVSNPAYSKQADRDYTLNALGDTVPSFDPYEMFPIERTYSEWQNSDFNTPGGISGTAFGGEKTSVSTCQDCHMAQVTSNLTSSGTTRAVGIHDLTGGNTFIPLVLSSMTASTRDSSIARATRMLKLAATLSVVANGRTIAVTVQNNTGHKLPSGYPEGRRIWLNVQAFNAAKTMIFESGSYDNSTGVLTQDSLIKIYEIEPGMSAPIAAATGLTAGPSFHFVLNDTVYKDNRIPPRGFTNANFEAIQSPPIGYSYNDGQYWDDTQYTLKEVPDSISVTLYYQTTSKEYVEFLRDNNTTNTTGTEIYNYWNSNGKSAPVVMARQTLNNSDIPLDASFSNFSVEMGEKFPVLKWQTQSETQNLGFIVYRREESETAFSELASYKTDEDLKGLGSSSAGKYYTYMDADLSLVSGRTYLYKIADVDYSGKITEHGMVTVTFNPGKIVSEFVLKNNYPNPFNSETFINFYISQKEPIEIKIYDAAGRLIRSFPKFLYFAGENQVKWDATDDLGNTVPSGLYFYAVNTKTGKKTGKMILLK